MSKNCKEHKRTSKNVKKKHQRTTKNVKGCQKLPKRVKERQRTSKTNAKEQ